MAAHRVEGTLTQHTHRGASQEESKVVRPHLDVGGVGPLYVRVQQLLCVKNGGAKDSKALVHSQVVVVQNGVAAAAVGGCEQR